MLPTNYKFSISIRANVKHVHLSFNPDDETFIAGKLCDTHAQCVPAVYFMTSVDVQNRMYTSPLMPISDLSEPVC